MSYVGLTWDHPRGYDALAEAAHRVNSSRDRPLVTWRRQPLEGFESAPIARLAAENDLLVLDHPHIGEAVATDCLIPLEELFDSATMDQWRAQSVGSAFESYRWGGYTYALPLDVAHQVMARRVDVVSKAPQDWNEVIDLARSVPVALSLAGPHAYLTLISIAGGWGYRAQGDLFLDDDVLESGLDVMRRLYALRPQGSGALNPIAMLEAMSGTEAIALVPLIFGYVTYAVARPNSAPLAFCDSPLGSSGWGGVLGGTGIGFSKRAKPSRELVDHLGWLMNEKTQVEFIPENGGQPSARAAWRSPYINNRWGNFYASTLPSAERALLRPRFDGVSAFQNLAASTIRDALARGDDHNQTIASLRAHWQSSRSRARGDLDDNRGLTHD